jgi:adenylate kinase family enzyme
MKVGFAGAQCTGKSTQATLLSERDGFVAVPSASRLAANMGVPVNREGNLSTQFVS